MSTKRQEAKTQSRQERPNYYAYLSEGADSTIRVLAPLRLGVLAPWRLDPPMRRPGGK